jgi:hypothetical protein
MKKNDGGGSDDVNKELNKIDILEICLMLLIYYGNSFQRE